MKDERKDCCPNCLSQSAVPKSVAWDAMTSIPAEVQKELERLRKIEQAAQPVATYCGPHVLDGEEHIRVMVMGVHLETLRSLFGYDPLIPNSSKGPSQ